MDTISSANAFLGPFVGILVLAVIIYLVVSLMRGHRW